MLHQDFDFCCFVFSHLGCINTTNLCWIKICQLFPFCITHHIKLQGVTYVLTIYCIDPYLHICTVDSNHSQKLAVAVSLSIEYRAQLSHNVVGQHSSFFSILALTQRQIFNGSQKHLFRNHCYNSPMESCELEVEWHKS